MTFLFLSLSAESSLVVFELGKLRLTSKGQSFVTGRRKRLVLPFLVTTLTSAPRMTRS